MKNLSSFRTSQWTIVSLLNFIILAFLGVTMRYKIGFEFPYFDQKHLQLAHSNFAFYGWISHTLMILMSSYIRHLSQQISVRKYYRCIVFNLIAAYGMLISFLLLGNHLISIICTLMAIGVSYFFSYNFIRDFRTVEIRSGASLWFRAALIYGVISSFGQFALYYMMITHTLSQHLYLLSLYFFLHFQYNGWFFFSIIGLAILMIRQYLPSFTIRRNAFWLMVLSCLPAYFLSALWLDIPLWVYILVIIASVTQVIAWFFILKEFIDGYKHIKQHLRFTSKLILLILAISISAKLALQLGSVVPVISKLAFGFRSIIIAYLHLVLLAIVSVFIILYLYDHPFMKINALSKNAVIIFVFSVYMNEIVLGIQGMASFLYFRLPYWNELLFVLSVCILFSLLLLFWSQIRKKGEISQT